jgi:ATP-dependent Clp endopeptidase proteolytic subunit ClpP
MNKIQKILKNYSNPRRWYTVNAANKDNPELLIYDAIGTDFWGSGLTPKDFISDLNEIAKTSKRCNLRINSPGGFIHDGFTIYNALVQCEMEIDVYVDGLAASAAAYIAQAGDRIFMAKNSEMMIHDAWGCVCGKAEDMRHEADHLDSLTDMIAGIFVDSTGNEKEVVRELMKNETWMNGEKAVELGFADELLEESQAAACLFDLDDDLLPGLPDGFKKLQNALKKRASEQSMRDAGLSRAEAKRRASNVAASNKPVQSGRNDESELRKQANELITKEISTWLVK